MLMVGGDRRFGRFLRPLLGQFLCRHFRGQVGVCFSDRFRVAFLLDDFGRLGPRVGEGQ